MSTLFLGGLLPCTGCVYGIPFVVWDAEMKLLVVGRGVPRAYPLVRQIHVSAGVSAAEGTANAGADGEGERKPQGRFFSSFHLLQRVLFFLPQFVL